MYQSGVSVISDLEPFAYGGEVIATVAYQGCILSFGWDSQVSTRYGTCKNMI
jgi:hypothetical protein